jgi:flagellar hook-associated protein 3 FlgL
VEFNDVTITYVDGGPGVAGAETAVYDDSDPLNKTLTITIASGMTTANRIIDVVGAAGTFIAELDPHEAGNTGTGTVLATAVDTTATAVTSGGSGVEFDQSSGLRIENGGAIYDINFDGAVTVEDLLNRLNGSTAGVLAEIGQDGKSISIRSRLSGADFSVGENGGSTAAQLGVRTLTETTRLTELNFGVGVIPLGPDGAPAADVPGPDFTIRRKDGVELDIDVTGTNTVQDILDLINLRVDNQDPATRVTARLAEFGNGIELVTADATPNASITVTIRNLSQAAVQLGLVPAGESTVSSGTTDRVTGRDVNPQQVEGAYSALIRLREALEANDTRAISRAIEMLDAAATDFSFARAELGVRQQSLDLMKTRLDNEVVELTANLSG